MVVLTGGIASGKTAVSDCFAALGVPIIDADRIAHKIVEPGQPGLDEIVGVFGADFLNAEGLLDRKRLRQAIFEDPQLRRRLESILHPIIRQEIKRQIRQTLGPYCIVVIPLFTDHETWSRINRVLVVDASEETQIERLTRRDNVDRRQAMSILAAQSTRDSRLSRADDVIVNEGTLEDLKRHVECLHKKYLNLADIEDL